VEVTSEGYYEDIANSHVVVYFAAWRVRKESEFEKLARLIKGEGEDVRGHVSEEVKRLDKRIDALDKKVELGFALVMRRLDTVIQIQLDEHASRIKKLETAVFK